MENNIGVDPGDLLGLQSELAKRLRIAHEKGDADFPKALAAILVASPGRRKLFVDEHPFKREGSILLREACSPTKGEQKIIDKDPRAMRVLHIDWDSIPYRSFVERDEKITGHEKLARMKREGVIRLDFSWAKVLLIDNEHYGTDSILEHLHREMGLRHLDFFGTVLEWTNDRSEPRHRQHVRIIFREHSGRWTGLNRRMSETAFDADCMSPVVKLTEQ